MRADVTILAAACVWCVPVLNQAKGITVNEILILGAGYTGMAATMSLAGRLKGRDDVHITLVNPQARFTERLRLHQTASGQVLPDLSIPDRLAGTGVEFVRGWVTGIDADGRRPSGSTTNSGPALRHAGLWAGQRRRHRGRRRASTTTRTP